MTSDSKLQWIDETCFQLGGQKFRAIKDLVDMFSEINTDEMLVAKPRSMLEKYQAYASELSCKNIFELGINRGGSTAFLHKLCQPQKLVAIDIMKQSSPELDRYIANVCKADEIRCYYDTDQSDIPVLEAILEREFPEQMLDLVSDDASHYLDETTTSFNLLFPKIRPGGLFIVEDWPWAHPAADGSRPCLADFSPQFRDKPALSSLIIEVLLAVGSGCDLIENIVIDQNCAYIRRSAASVGMDNFDIRKAYGLCESSPITLRQSQDRSEQ